MAHLVPRERTSTYAQSQLEQSQQTTQGATMFLQKKVWKSGNNVMTAEKQQYIVKMRKDLCGGDICNNDGDLNLKYFNVKKGQYWSPKEKALLIEAVIKHGPTKYAQIKSEFLSTWTETEIRLRICRLLKYYNLEDYNSSEKRLMSKEDIETEAAANKERAFEERIQGNPKIMVGGIYYNPPDTASLTGGDTFYNSFFSAKNNAAAAEAAATEPAQQ